MESSQMRLSRLLIVGLLALGLSTPLSGKEEMPTEIRLGVVAYEKFAQNTDKYKKAMTRLLAKSGLNATVRLAVGSYAEVLHWYEQELIDVAVFTPGPAALLFADPAKRAALQEGYVATRLLEPARNPFASAERRDQTPDPRYQSICVVRADDGPKTAEELLAHMTNGRVQFYVTHPLSASSFLLPAFVLRAHGIDLRDRDAPVEYTYDHLVSLQRVAAPDVGAGPHPVKFACVWDDAGVSDPTIFHNLRAIDIPRRGTIPALSELFIPQEIVVVNTRTKAAGHLRTVMRTLLLNSQLTDFRYRDLSDTKATQGSDWVSEYRNVVEWFDSAKLSQDEVERSQIHLDEVISKIAVDAANDHRPVRIALVLSGGGAKCAYQVGALRAIERALAAKNLSPHLIAGTSGGAINAFASALDLLTLPDGFARVSDLWRTFEQSDFFQPWPTIRWSGGVVLGLFEAFIVVSWIGLTRQLLIWTGERTRFQAWLGLAGIVLLVVAAAHLAVLPLVANIFSNSAERASHWWSHLALGINIVSYVAPLVVAFVGLLALVLRRFSAAEWPVLSRCLLTTSTIAVIGLFWITFFHNTTIAHSGGITGTFTSAVPELLEIRVKMLQDTKVLTSSHADRVRSSIKKAVFGGSSDSEILARLSRIVIDEKLLARDLMITGSQLALQTETASAAFRERLPADLYFAYGASPRPRDGRFISLENGHGKELLLDAVVGSTLIFPVFPYHPVTLRSDQVSAAGAGTRINLIDGGFTHNSPIEAAVLWNATHIILVEASPEPSPPKNDSLLTNAFTAFNLLYEEAQRVDRLARGKVQIFELRPRPRCGKSADPGRPAEDALDLLDFDPWLIEGAIEKGDTDAKCKAPLPFRRVTGEPSFVEIGS
jgi:predicted acylesterase/phospholipase RssA/ABC-type phosphate/phosphonate transport system substrate-binding protein